MGKFSKTLIASSLVALLSLAGCSPVSEDDVESSGSGASDDQVVIYSNADEEPLQIITDTLNDNGYSGQFVVQTFGTSELGGKLLAEGANTEADMLTMSSFYLESAQEQNDMFKSLDLEVQPLDDSADFYAPMTGQEGTLFYNTIEFENVDVDLPQSLKDLADPQYEGMVSIPDINHSSTAWLLFQALIDNYGEEAQTILEGIYANAGDQVEQSGSGPLKKVNTGEAIFGFGLRHQAVSAKEAGDPIEVIDPAEGTYVLTESFALVDKGEDSKEIAEEMLDVLLAEARPQIQELYPTALYEGETSEGDRELKVFPEKLTAELLEEHKALVQ